LCHFAQKTCRKIVIYLIISGARTSGSATIASMFINILNKSLMENGGFSYSLFVNVALGWDNSRVRKNLDFCGSRFKSGVCVVYIPRKYFLK